ncbi:MAG TPA: hypothetical protein VHZ29_04335 [Rhizomicrobium sp.]|nr:hypothetical protein [Rhizomicrobium sp.]
MSSRVIPCIALVFGVLVAGGAQAWDNQGNPSLDRILPQIRERHPGKFYDAEGPWRGPDGQMRYRLKWMTPDGRIVWFDADARTGRVLSPEFDRRERFGPPPPPPYREERRFERDRPWPGEGRPRRGR